MLLPHTFASCLLADRSEEKAEELVSLSWMLRNERELVQLFIHPSIYLNKYVFIDHYCKSGAVLGNKEYHAAENWDVYLCLK